MRILFWNAGKRPVADLLRDLSRLRSLDVIILAEVADPIGKIVSRLNKDAEQVYSSPHEPFRTGPREFRLLSRGDVSKDSATAITEGRQPHSVFLLQPNVESLRRSSSESSRVLLPPEFGTHGVLLALVRPSPASAGYA